MAYLVGKIAVLAVMILVAQAQQNQPQNQQNQRNQGTRQVPSPDASWDEYQIKQCCPRGFIEVLNYCVQCNAPNVFDVIDQKCGPCPADHVYNNASKRCDCKIPCESPRQLNANNICECPADQKGVRRVYNPSDRTCNCPANLPLWNGKYCVACPSGTEFDPKEHQCYHCPEGFVRDTGSHACVPGF